jgi:hypothetical protein
MQPKGDRLTRSGIYVVTALLITACQDPVGPTETASLDQVQADTASSSFTINAVLSSHLVATGAPITYVADFARQFSSISRVSYLWTFGSDPLDPGDCLHVFPNDSPGGFGVCNPSTAPQTSRLLTFPCSTFPEVCDSFRDGVSAGQMTAEFNAVPQHPVSVGISSFTVTIEGTIAPDIRTTITIDIKPGSAQNTINPRSRGLISVAILTTATFDATTVLPYSVRFGPSATPAVDARGRVRDVDGDGDRDLVLRFRTRATGIRCGDNSATLTGTTSSGQKLQGSGSLRTVGCKHRS